MTVYIVMGWSPWSDGDWVIGVYSDEKVSERVRGVDSAHRYTLRYELDKVPFEVVP